jgi:anti-anti-sigma factor
MRIGIRIDGRHSWREDGLRMLGSLDYPDPMSTTLVVVEHADTHSHVQIIGPLDLAGVGMVELKLTASTVSRRRHAILDMSQVPFVASLGLGMLVQVARSLAAHGLRLVVLAPTDMVATALRTSRLDAVMPIAEHLEAAKAHLEA